MSNQMTEAELAADVVQFMEDDLYECYFEVEGPGGRADIIGKAGPVLHVVEVKLNFNWSVLEQAVKWRPYAHYVSVAVRKPKKYTVGLINNHAVQQFLRYKGIGVITVNTGRPTWKMQPTILRRAATDLIHLREEHKTWKRPGETGGGYYTAFASTKMRLLDYISKNPGCTMGEILAHIEYHYATERSARSSLHNYIMKGVIPGVRVEGGNPSRYFIDETVRYRGGIDKGKPRGLDGFIEDLTK